ncbi:hypothetical protein G7092_17750 [Mucilaginibacter sp. HC2]|uniref:hypothetical protein n=1 Tax=Mucilaginibacter TaxID=423349 RepID=UPI00101A3403|nr:MULTISPECIES: hypothetical protein [Mucilaginibacter]NHA05661.1 hypothetical protein [Mucilaginibacter inviolabilis]QTE35465.1 hypothetical protein J3L18_20235 [Mucilaginibacter gossypii]
MHNETLNIWKQFDKGLKQYVCGKVNHGEECHDILQNLYLKIDSYVELVKKVRNLPSCLFRMAHHEVMNHYRGNSKYELHEVMGFDRPVHDPEVRDGSLKLADCCLYVIYTCFTKYSSNDF